MYKYHQNTISHKNIQIEYIPKQYSPAIIATSTDALPNATNPQPTAPQSIPPPNYTHKLLAAIITRSTYALPNPISNPITKIPFIFKKVVSFMITFIDSKFILNCIFDYLV